MGRVVRKGFLQKMGLELCLGGGGGQTEGVPSVGWGVVMVCSGAGEQGSRHSCWQASGASSYLRVDVKPPTAFGIKVATS